MLSGVNDSLRNALAHRGWSSADLAQRIELDEKTVERWITKDRRPHRRNQRLAAEALELSIDQLWPDDTRHDVAAASAHSEIVGIYPNRASVPQWKWMSLLKEAQSQVDILVFAGTFLNQTNPRFPAMLAERAEAGARVRLCCGDPSGDAVALRGKEEGIGSTLGAKVQASLTYFSGLVGVPGCEIRLHDTALYASIFRYDSQAMINTHLWGSPASANPLLHVRDTGEDSMFRKYTESFDAVWGSARSWTAE